MNVYELTSQVLRQCRLDPADATDRSENESWIVAELNNAYKQLCTERLNPWTTEEVTLDANKCFDTTTLDNALVRILKITKYRDYSAAVGGIEMPRLSWDLYGGDGVIVVPYAESSGNVFIEYEYMPVDLAVMEEEAGESFVASATNTPQINAQWHPVLTYWATAQYFMTKGPNYIAQSQMWTQMYEREKSKASSYMGEAQEIKGIFNGSIL